MRNHFPCNHCLFFKQAFFNLKIFQMKTLKPLYHSIFLLSQLISIAAVFLLFGIESIFQSKQKVARIDQ
jgi:hypothetical protein